MPILRITGSLLPLLALACSPASESQTPLEQPAVTSPSMGTTTVAAQLLAPAVLPERAVPTATHAETAAAPNQPAESSQPRWSFLDPDPWRLLILREEAQGSRHLHGYLVAVPQSDYFLEKHYQGLPLTDVYAKYQDLVGVLEGKSQGSRGHTVNGQPTHADASVLQALLYEKDWLLKRVYAQWEQEKDERLAAGITPRWLDAYAHMGPSQTSVQLWLQRQLLTHERSRNGRLATLT